MIEGPRAARENELPALVALSNAVFYPDGSVDIGRLFPNLFARANVGNLRVTADDGTPISLAGMTVQDITMNGVVLRSACIGSVCTRQEYRGRGLAARLMDDCIAAARADGVSLILVSGARGLYRRIGCVDAGMFKVIRVDRTSRLPEVPCHVRPWDEEDVPEMEALHTRENVRFVRAPGQMAAFLRTRALRARPSRTWIVQVGGRIAAYLCIAEGTAREIAGSRHAVLAAVPAILDAAGDDCVDIEVPHSDVAMVSLAASFGLATRGTGMDGTLKIINRKQFFAAFPLVISDSVRALSDEDFAALVFGSMERQSPDFGEALRRVFPLPLPGYGLNYI